MLLAQPAIALAQGRADGIGDNNFDHKDEGSLLITVDCNIPEFPVALLLFSGRSFVDEPNVQPITVDDIAHFWRHALILPRFVVVRMRDLKNDFAVPVGRKFL